MPKGGSEENFAAEFVQPFGPHGSPGEKSLIRARSLLNPAIREVTDVYQPEKTSHENARTNEAVTPARGPVRRTLERRCRRPDD
jgi:hypothetical protein